MIPAHAAEIRVISAEAVRDVLEAVATQFSKDTGHTVSFEFMTAGQVRAKVEAGEPVDLAIASSGFMAELVKAGKDTGEHRSRPHRHGGCDSRRARARRMFRRRRR